MALSAANANTLGAAIALALTGLPATTTSEDYWKEACRQIYAAIKADAEVNTTVAAGIVVEVVGPLAGATTGPGAGSGTLT